MNHKITADKNVMEFKKKFSKFIKRHYPAVTVSYPNERPWTEKNNQLLLATLSETPSFFIHIENLQSSAVIHLLHDWLEIPLNDFQVNFKLFHISRVRFEKLLEQARPRILLGQPEII